MPDEKKPEIEVVPATPDRSHETASDVVSRLLYGEMIPVIENGGAAIDAAIETPQEPIQDTTA